MVGGGEQMALLEDARDVVTLHPRDERALSFVGATWHVSEPQVSFLFRCAYRLDPKAPPVTDWIAECMERARQALPEVFARIEREDILCFAANGPLAHP